jgi:twitching motility protein PilJ
MIAKEPEASSLAEIGNSQPPKFSSPLRAWFSSHLVETLSAAVVLSLMLSGASAWNTWNAYRGFQSTIAKQFRLQNLSGQIVHFDEVLTMSARMAASTGDNQWETRYRTYEPSLDKAIKEVIKLAPESYQNNAAATDAANLKLVEMENLAFALVRQSEQSQALKLLQGKEYDRQKQIYATGIQNALTNIQTTTDAQIKSYSQRLFWSLIFAGVSFPALAISWLGILSAVRAYIRDRDRAQQSLLESQETLFNLNQEIQQSNELLAAKEQATQRENEILMADVTDILEIVSEMEQGNLTVEAQVNDRATGLVADTLNRLSEALTRIIAQVLQTAEKVTEKTGELEHLAIATARAAQQQTESVMEVQGLMNSVNEISQDTAQQAIAASVVVQQTRFAVTQGQQEMGAMTTGIAALQQGKEQIVKRTETLTDFVELAAQFSRDQKRVAALTRVLALNATTIASRASQQQDPEQFTSVAREFETIASQVNDLAVETNQNLLLLQQRTEQIQTVVSGLNQDVQQIEQLVNGFTLGVGQSRQVFDSIKAVTEQLVNVEQEVTNSSQNIAKSARETLKAIQAIATVAAQTEQQASVTREESGSMEQLASSLLELVKFFQIERSERDLQERADSAYG